MFTKKSKTSIDFQNLFDNDDFLFTPPQKRKVKAKKISKINFDDLQIQNDKFTFEPLSFNQALKKTSEEKNQKKSETVKKSEKSSQNAQKQ